MRQPPAPLLGDETNDVDGGVLQRPETLEAFRRVIPEQSIQGVGGSVDDTLAFVCHWGFDLNSIRVPVLVTYGDADTSCPVAHGRFLAAAVPGATAIETAGGGHIAAPTKDILDTHKWLVAGHHRRA